MEDFTLCLTTNYVFGRGVEEQVGKLTSALGSRALVCCGHSSARKSGVWQKVLGSLEQAGVHTVTLEGIDPNPTDDRVYEGIEICRKAGVDVIVAVGGGSVSITINSSSAVAVKAVLVYKANTSLQYSAGTIGNWASGTYTWTASRQGPPGDYTIRFYSASGQQMTSVDVTL